MEKKLPRPRALPILTAIGAILAAGALVAITAMTAIAAAVPPNLGKAIETQKQLAAERPQDAAVFNDLGNLLVLAHQPAEAEAAYRRAVEIDPHKASAMFNLGLLLQQQGNAGDARQLYQKVIEVEPRHAWAHYQVGTLYERKGEKSRAIREYARAFALDPQLAFREVNPQIVENGLVTESMLRAYRRESSATEAPSIYDEPLHIRDLLVPPAPKEAAAEQPPGARPGGGAAQHPAILRREDLPPGGNLGQATAPGAHPTPAGQTGARATVPNSYGGAAVPGYSPPTYNSDAFPNGRQWTRPNPSPDGTQPGTVVTPPPAGIYYRPGAPSTGRLDSQVTSEQGG